ncbi:hypothetical protein U9M48_026886 [Paspalum notatum var. saurae]|uniref:Uncharacterized protein n=1 Tax=Paspalum notatum var. saurae TaxID=547442 RepID=A0AAQ3WYS8_PASNO
MSPSKLATMPLILTRSLDKHLVPCIQFLRGIIGTDGDICSTICRAPRVLLADKKNMRPVVDTLRRLGLPEKSISKLIVMEMNVLTFPPDRVSQIVEDVKALDLVETDMGFPYAMRALCRLDREACLRKMDLYRSFGVSEGELQKALVRQPTMLHISSESINKKLRFFLDELKLELSDVMSQPVLISRSLEKCIIPRCAVLSVLMREGKIGPNVNVLWALLSSNKRFSKRYVLRYAHDVPDVIKAFEGKIAFEGFRDQDF